MIENLIKQEGNLNKLLTNIPNKQISVFGCGENERLAIIDSLDSFILYLTPTINDAIRINDELLLLNKNSLVFNPDFNFKVGSFFNYNYINSTLNKILFGEINALVLPITNLMYKLPNPNSYKEFLFLKVGQTLKRANLIEQLNKLNYKQVDEIENVCEYRIFGDIIDIYPINCELIVRVGFFDDEIENIYSVNEEYQKVNSYNEFYVYSNKFFDNINYEKVKKEINGLKLKANSANEIDELNNILNMLELNSLCPFFNVYDDTINFSILNYLPKDTTIVLDDTKILYDNLNNSINDLLSDVDENIKNFTMLASHKNVVFNLNEVLNTIKNFQSVVAFQMLTQANRFFNPQMVFNLKSIPVGNYINKNDVLANDISNFLATKNTVLLFVKNKDNIEHFQNILNAHRISNVVANYTRNIIKNTVNILPINYNLSFGFREENIVVLGGDKLFGAKKLVKSKHHEIKTDEYLPQVNDYVVHETHGVGRYLGVENLHLNNTQKDYLVIEYKNNDKLYLPVEYTNRLAKYVGGDSAPTLNKLGSFEFENIKRKVKSSLKELAFNLIELYKKREESKGFVYYPEPELENAFKNSFPYTETVDQQKAINDCMQDLESGKVLDRLICGDVGYGKTEVALRVIFKTAIHGKQCMFMCPTTVLSEQHYNTCVSRLQDFGIKVEVLNRFKTKSQTKDILEKLANGEIDVICGTHRLLSSDVKFKDLGLLVLDEEQKFGVGDKEKIKNIKTNINVLTLSATPIPRTLHMSMVGIRDISIINTPPDNRLNVATTVIEYSDVLLKNAIEKEINRDGQVLVIYNRIDGIYNIANHISSMFNNEIVVDVAHGQMTQEKLEDAIYKLFSGKTQVLVATTLIENGVDLPKANTLFVIDADNLGLSQLYQLKGRVGRYNIQAYAYFTYANFKVLNSDAYKRLQAIMEYSDMGSGYKIAMRDLEIRGAGNVLGPQQHGHMLKVGYAMYVNLLNQAIEEVKANKELSNFVDTKIETNLSAYMPEDFVENEKDKISIYNEISNVKNSTELINLVNKLKGEFNEIPIPLINLIKVALIKNLATMLNIEKVVINKNKTFLQFRNSNDLFTEKIQDAVSIYKQNVVLNLTNLPIIELINITEENVLDLLIDFLTYLS